ncbi:MAG TPA: carbohydrate kinase [Cyanobacteria bacterium UBA12227]|nr:carbohydrate kinase [Cyanobacteria bacterium UBA12227]HAX84803.1 carbohydrate kinase [Cyanobacteria bacterium UBA11370]HBY78416.1 carbohydrate kinase [Cyanobacteria bacterium UBA11148]
MTSPRVLCLGEVLFDCLADQLGRSLEQVESWTPYPGGAPANVACALVKLGTPAGFIGCVGEDEPGNQLIEVLQNVGVDSTGIQRHSTAPTRQVYVVRSETGDREFAGFGDLDTSQFADAFLQGSNLPESLFANAEFLVLGTLELAYPQTRKAITRALQLADQHHVKVLVDINWRPMFWPDPSAAKPLIEELLKHIDFLKIAKEEAELFFDTSNAGVIKHRLDLLEGVLVTDGDQDCSYCLGDQEGTFPAFSVNVQDTTGAGDAFVAGFVHQLCEYGLKCIATPEAARNVVKYACAVGALTTLKPGAIAAQPTASEVDAFLDSY